jgi:hypothetical protein
MITGDNTLIVDYEPVKNLQKSELVRSGSRSDRKDIDLNELAKKIRGYSEDLLNTCPNYGLSLKAVAEDLEHYIGTAKEVV